MLVRLQREAYRALEASGKREARPASWLILLHLLARLTMGTKPDEADAGAYEKLEEPSLLLPLEAVDSPLVKQTTTTDEVLDGQQSSSKPAER